MSNWCKKDIERKVKFLDEFGKEGEVAIVNVYKEVPNTIRVVEYPISLKSKIFHLGLPKEQEKEDSYGLKEPGDWYSEGKVSKDESDEIKRIIIPERVLSK